MRKERNVSGKNKKDKKQQDPGHVEKASGKNTLQKVLDYLDKRIPSTPGNRPPAES